MSRFKSNNSLSDTILCSRFLRLVESVCKGVIEELDLLEIFSEPEVVLFQKTLWKALFNINSNRLTDYVHEIGEKCSEETRKLLSPVNNSQMRQLIFDTLLTKCVWSTTVAYFEPGMIDHKNSQTGKISRRRSTKGLLQCLTRTGKNAYRKNLLFLLGKFNVNLKERHEELFRRHKKILEGDNIFEWRAALIDILMELHKKYWCQVPLVPETSNMLTPSNLDIIQNPGGQRVHSKERPPLTHTHTHDLHNPHNHTQMFMEIDSGIPTLPQEPILNMNLHRNMNNLNCNLDNIDLINFDMGRNSDLDLDLNNMDFNLDMSSLNGRPSFENVLPPITHDDFFINSDLASSQYLVLGSEWQEPPDDL